MDVDAFLKRADPARWATMDGPDSPEADRLYRRIVAGSAEPARLHRHIRRLVLSCAAVTAAGGLVAALTLAGLPGSPAPQSSRPVPGSPARASAPAVAVLLNSAALTAASQPNAPAPGRGQYEYVRLISGNRAEVSYSRGCALGAHSGRAAQRRCVQQLRYRITHPRKRLCVQTIQIWAAPDGAGRQLASPQREPGCLGDQSTTFPKGTRLDGEGAFGALYPDAASLPTRPAALEHWIEQRFEQGQAGEYGATFYFAGTFLQAGAPPAVRAALYRMISLLPGVQDLGRMTDRLGRMGIGIGLTQHGVRDVLIFDPSTSAVLEREAVVTDTNAALRSHFGVGTTAAYTVYVTSGVVNSETATVSGPATGAS